MRIACVGGGPGGMHAAGLLAATGHEVTVVEQGPRGASAGWGVTFPPGFLAELAARDSAAADRLRAVVAPWDTQLVQLGSAEPVRSPAAGQAVRRSTLVRELADHAEALGVELVHDRRVAGIADLPGFDLVIAADGARSALRTERAGAFGTRVDVHRNRYTWLGTTQRFPEFLIPFVPSRAGWLWAGASSFEPGTSGFYVETTEATWRRLGLDTMDDDAALACLEDVFADHLDGHRLLGQTGRRGGVPWLQFHRVTNRRWHHGSTVLLGDAARTVHFSVGQGTVLAMEDARVLAEVLSVPGPLPAALAEYTRRRRRDVAPLQAAARTSLAWFEHADRYTGLDPVTFSMVYHRRSSPVVRRTPVALYAAAARATRVTPSPDRWLASRAPHQDAHRIQA